MTKFRRGPNHRNQGDPFNSNWRRRDNNPPPPPPLAHMPPQPYGMGNAGMNPGVGMGMGNYYYPGGVRPMPPHTAPLQYPSPMQRSPMQARPVHSAAGPAAVNMRVNAAHSVATVPGYPDRYYPRQPQIARPLSTSPPRAGPLSATPPHASPLSASPPRAGPLSASPPRAGPLSASPESSEGVPSVAHWAEDVAKHHLVDETCVKKATLTARMEQSADEEKRLFLEEYRYAGPQAYEPPSCPKFTESDLEKNGSSTDASGNSLEKRTAASTGDSGNSGSSRSKGKAASSGDSGDSLEQEKGPLTSLDKGKGTSSTGDNGNSLDQEKESSSKSKLRGDAPEFIPQKRRQFNRMVVTS